MDRRAFLTFVSAGFVARALDAEGQQAAQSTP